MLIIANEDIGSGDSSVIVKIKTLYDCWKEGLADERLCVIHAALILARAPKSRACCNLSVFLYDQKATPKIDIPDYAFDRHTQVGYEKGRKWEHCITDASKLVQPDWAQIAACDEDYQGKAEAVLRDGWKPFKTPKEEFG
jgi:replication-associated recombination protein RarA